MYCFDFYLPILINVLILNLLLLIRIFTLISVHEQESYIFYCMWLISVAEELNVYFIIAPHINTQ